MSRMTGKDDKGRYYTVEEKILIFRTEDEPVNPTTTWIVGNENRRYGSPIDKLGTLEDLEEKYDLPLDVLVTLLDHYYYYDEDGNQKFLHSLDMYHKQIVIKKYENDDDIYGYYEHLNFKDYKKTWWINADKTF